MTIKSKNYAGEMCTLVLEDDGQPVQAGMILTSGRGERYRITGGAAPHKPGSTGKVWLQSVDDADDEPGFEMYPGVVKAMWMDDRTLAALVGAVMKAEEDDAMPTLPARKPKAKRTAVYVSPAQVEAARAMRAALERIERYCGEPMMVAQARAAIAVAEAAGIKAVASVHINDLAASDHPVAQANAASWDKVTKPRRRR